MESKQSKKPNKRSRKQREDQGYNEQKKKKNLSDQMPFHE